MHLLKKSILKVITYFDVFNYPVNLQELNFFLDQPAENPDHIRHAAEELIESGILYKINGFYLLKNDSTLVERRLKGNKEAGSKLEKAVEIARFLSKFPYINGIAISGSLSKNFSYEGSDLDFFIITKANRLWLAKTFFTVFLKIARLFNKGHLYCLNYFIDEMALEIEEKNIFTATEIITLLPCEGRKLFDDFFAANKWVDACLPNSIINKKYSKEMKSWFFKKMIESIFNNRMGNAVDTAILNYYHRRWEQLRKKNVFTNIGFQLGGLVARKHCCKPFPEHIQKNILDKFERKYKAIISSSV